MLVAEILDLLSKTENSAASEFVPTRVQYGDAAVILEMIGAPSSKSVHQLCGSILNRQPQNDVVDRS